MSIEANKKLRIFRRDGFQCKNCGNNQNLTLDHVKPKSLGGTDDDSNLRTLCKDCNLKRGNFNPSFWERISNPFVSKKMIHGLKNDFKAELGSKIELLKRDIQSELHTKIGKLEKSLSELIKLLKQETDIKIVGLENTANAYSRKSKERDEKLLVFLEALSEYVK